MANGTDSKNTKTPIYYVKQKGANQREQQIYNSLGSIDENETLYSKPGGRTKRGLNSDRLIKNDFNSLRGLGYNVNKKDRRH